MVDYVERLADRTLAALLVDHPAVLLVGPRASGKTTTAQRLAGSAANLGRQAEAAVFRADPDAALVGRAEPVLIDEWQAAPEVLGAVKRAVDAEPRRGRVLITGSARADLDAETWPGTGRLVRLRMFGLSEREVDRNVGGRLFLNRIADGETPSAGRTTLGLRDYVDVAMRGGFPEPALRLDRRARERWFDGYVDQLVTRDAAEIEHRRSTVRLRAYLEAYALNSAGVVDETTLIAAAQTNRRSADAYRDVLLSLGVIDELPAWTPNRLRRMTLASKRYVVDAGLLTALMNVDQRGVMGDGDVLGRLIETFVVAQLRTEIEHLDRRARMFHLRQQDGRREIDVIVELGGGRVIAIEIKATSAPTAHDARHLRWLRDELGVRMIAGIVLHTGPRSFALDDRLTALPISTVWA